MDQQLCEHLADVAQILPARIGIAAGGGNAVPGTASTLGMRLGSVPRMSLGLRATGARVQLPRVDAGRDRGFLVYGIAADGSMGIYQGMTLLPTVGGFGSVDLLASASVLPLRGGSGFQDGTTFSWAAGARLGILRESFTAPGISVDVLYRGVGDVQWEEPAAAPRSNALQLERNRVTAVRGVVGKRVFGFGATAGAAWERYSTNVRVTLADTTPGDIAPLTRSVESGIATSRTSFFGNLSMTLLILNLGIEGGWQSGGSAPAGASPLVGKGGLFGGIAARLAI